MLKIIHCADVHAGRPAPASLSREKASLRRWEIEKSLERIVEITHEERADILLVAGDLFEHLYTGAAWVRQAAALLSSIPDTQVFISPGNHDPAVRDSLYHSLTWPGNVRVFGSPALEEVVLSELGAAVYGFGWASFTERDRVLQGRTVRYKDLLNILVIHGQLVPVPADPAEPAFQYLPIPYGDILNFGADYVALGHVHAPTAVHIGEAVAVYPGCPEPLDFGDSGERGIYLVTATRDSQGSYTVEPRFIPMCQRQMRSVDVDISGFDTGEQVMNKILGLDTEEARKRDLWSVNLTGVLAPELELDAAGLERDMEDEFFYLRLVSEYLPGYDLDAVAGGKDTLEARFVRRMQSIMSDREGADDDRGAKAAELAMYYGLDALRQGKVLLRRRCSG